ncbi:MAG: DUF4384 domain-containing protein [Candidatus Sumerlaeota bacterium]|nr:DUF4384 domain-containing protein [Candidatus Sumerlaeota bacterium]
MMFRKGWTQAGLHVGLFLLAAALAGAAPSGGGKSAAEGKSKETKHHNKDLYLDQDTPPDQVKPTVKFWVERWTQEDEKGKKDLDYVTDTDEETFHTGDKVVFKFAANVNAYCYLVNKGTSGDVTMLYPGPAGRENFVKARQTRTMPTEKGAFQFKGEPGDEELCLVLSPEKIQEFEDIADAQSKAQGSRAFDLSTDQKKVWDKLANKGKVFGKKGANSRDLVLEQDENPGPGETPGNYVTDESSEGFHEPITIYLTLKHEA